MHVDSDATSEPAVRVAVLTSYTSDYECGRICSPMNRRYAERHGYAFVERIFPPLSAEAPPERHPTWNKVALVNDVLDHLLPAGGAAWREKKREEGGTKIRFLTTVNHH